MTELVALAQWCRHLTGTKHNNALRTKDYKHVKQS